MTDPKTTVTAVPWPLRSDLALGALPSAIPCARLHTKHVLHEWGLKELSEPAELIVSELTTNALRAATVPDGQPRYESELSGLPVVHVRLSSDRARVLIEVWDRSAGTPSAKNPAPDEEGGRGLMLVDALCDRWSWEVVPGWAGKVVWAQLQVK